MKPPLHDLDYHATSFSQGRMDFEWEELSETEIEQAYADWEAGKGLIGGNPTRIPHADRLPPWALDQPFVRALALDDRRSNRGEQLRQILASDEPLELEIGFGRGDFLLDRALRYPERQFFGYETKTKATRLFLNRVARLGYTNLWCSDDDCRFSMPRIVPAARLAMIHILFPDPWWKPQHQVRRLMTPPMIDLLARTLQPGGIIHFKTDVEAYANMVRYLIGRHEGFAAHDPALAGSVGDAAPTHREQWCRRNDRPVFAAYYERRA